jgi:hypothetical protein
MRTLLLAVFLLVPTAVLAQAATHSATITTTATAPGTATVMRATGACPATGVPSSGTTLTSTLAIPTAGVPVPYTDSTITATSCYWVTFSATGGGSAVSNTFLGTIVSVSITVVAQ